MRIRNDGSIQASATPTFQNAGRSEDFGLYRCVVVKVKYVDDPQNITTNAQNPRVLYDCVVQGGFASGQKISNCRLSSDLGGNSSFWERTLRASSKDVSKTRLSECDGDIVYVQFNQGHTGSPVIVALDVGIAPVETGASQAQGPRSVRQYNGVREEINNSGELQIDVKGGSANPEKGAFTPSATPLLTMKASKDEAYTRTFKSGLSITEDGKNDVVTVKTKGGVTITADGKNDEITLVTKGGAKLHIKQAKVAMGAGSIELLDELSKITDLISKFVRNTDALHTHIGNLGYPTEIPDQYPDFITLADNLDTEKGKVDTIKGTLS